VSTSLTPARRASRTRTATVAISDYVGRPAATAADELRRAGLRPGIERVDAVSPGELGMVVGHDPAATASVARNSVVTLYVAAALAEPPQTAETDPLCETAEVAATVRPRRRRRPRTHIDEATEEADPSPSRFEAAPPADGPVTPRRAERPIGPDGAAAASDVDVPDRWRVHQDAGESAGPDWWAADSESMLAPLPGVPRRWPPTGAWRRVPRRVRLAIAALAVLVVVLLATALSAPGPRPRPTASVNRAVALRPPRVAPARRKSPQLRRRSDGERSSSPQRPSRPAAPTLTAPLAPPSGPAITASAPAPPLAAAGPIEVDGQIPGGPFSP
jgi:hypothetical protein